MHTNVHYLSTQEENNTNAIADIREYCSQAQWDALMQFVGQVDCGAATIAQLNFGMGIAGISGYPFHAFCRKYLLKQYIEWMTSGKDAQVVDEAGFIMKEEGK